MQFRALIIDGFRESLDRKIFWVIVAISLFVAAAMFCVGFENDRVSLVFGLWEAETDHYDTSSEAGRAHVVGLVIHLLMPIFLGWIGVVLMIIGTAGMFPAFMERGAIDVVLAKPISRPRLFLYKYLAGMVFVLFHALLFVGVTFLVMGLRWRVWVPGYLWCIPLLVLLFSYLYCVSVLVAVRTQSTVAAILLTLAAWVVFVSPQHTVAVFELYPSFKEHNRLYQAFRVASWIPPKTGDVPYLAGRWTGAGPSLDVFPSSVIQGENEAERAQLEHARQWEPQLLEMNPLYSIGSSLLFEVLVVLWAMWLFARKDY